MAFSRKALMALICVAFVLPFFATTAMADDGSAALKYVPKDSMFVLSIDMEGLQGTEVFKQMMTMAMQEKEVKEGIEQLKEATGFDYTKDLHSIVIAAPSDVNTSEDFVIIMKGKFDEKKFINFAKEENGKLVEKEHAKMTWYEIDKEGGLAFDGDIAVIGSTKYLKAALDTKSAKNVKDAKVLGGYIKKVNTKHNIWAALTIPADIRKEMAAADPNAEKIEGGYASLDFGSGLKLDLTMITDSKDTAKALADEANKGLKAAASDPSIAQMGLDAMIAKITVAASGEKVAINIDLNEQEFATLSMLMQGLMGGMH